MKSSRSGARSPCRPIAYVRGRPEIVLTGRLAALDPETDRILFEVRTLLRLQSALSEPRLASRVQAMMATTQAARPAFRPGEPSAGGLDLERTSNEAIAAG